MEDLKIVFSYLRPHRREMAAAVVLLLLECVFEMAIPLIMTDIVDVGVPTHDIPYLLRQGGWMVLCALLALLTGLAYARFAARAAYGFGAQLRLAEYRRLQSYAFSNLDRFSAPSLVTRMTTDVTVMQNVINAGLRPLVRSPVMLVLGIGLAHAYEVAHRQDFPAITLGSRIIVPRDRFMAWIGEQAEKKFQ